MNFILFIFCVYIAWRVSKQRVPRRPTGCNYQPHERTHSDTLTKFAAREVRDLRKELKDAGMIP